MRRALFWGLIVPVLLKAAFRKPWLYFPALVTELAAPLLQFRALAQTGPASAPTSWRRGLLLGEVHIGDVLYNTASLPFLKQGLPACEWFYLAEPPAAEVLQTNPHLAGVIPLPRPRGGRPDAKKILAHLRELRLDVAVAYNCGMYRHDLGAAIRAGIPNRVGYVHKGFSGWVTHPVPFRHRQPYAAYFRDLVAHLTGLAPTWSLRPQVFPTPEDEAKAAEAWLETSSNPDRPRLACFVTTRQPSGSWPWESFGAALQPLSGRVQVVLCGAAGDREILEKLRAAFCPQATILAGRLPLRALVAFLRRCRACLCADSGPRHLANAAGIPVVFPRNLWFGKEEAGPYLPTEVDVSPDCEFLSDSAQAEALRAIPPSRVTEKLWPLL